MKVNSEYLRGECRRALDDHLLGGGEASLKRAYDLGRYALDNGYGILDMTALLHDALLESLAVRHPGEESVGVVRSSRDFFAECLSPFEMTHRGSQETTAVLRRLNEDLNEKLEEMARRIASALHDEAGQLMAMVHMDLHGAADELPASARRRLQKVRRHLTELEQNLRRISHEIRPRMLDDLGVLPALRFLAKGISQRSGVPVKVEGTQGKRFPPRIETSIYRIVQEALVNLSRHANATQASVLIKNSDGRVTCAVRDNGVGFDLKAVFADTGHSGLGLLGIQERVAALGGCFKVNSSPGGGTELVVDIPLDKPEGHAESQGG